MPTEPETTIETDVPPFEPGEIPAKAERGPLDPITKHLWRFKRPERVRLLLPFVDHEVKLERWFGRVAANGDQTYNGTVLAVATTTIGSAADLVIIKTVEGNVWAISTAQVAYLEATTPPVKATRKTVAAHKDPNPRTARSAVKVDPAPATGRGRRKAKVEQVSDATAA